MLMETKMRHFQRLRDGQGSGQRQPGRGEDLHVARRAAKFVHAYVHKETDAADERVFEKMGKPESRYRAVFRLLQFLPRPRHSQNYTGHAVRYLRSHLGIGGVNQ